MNNTAKTTPETMASRVVQLNFASTNRRRMSKCDAETRLNIIHGIVENVELHRSLDSYKSSTAEEKVAYLENIMMSLWVATHSK